MLLAVSNGLVFFGGMDEGNSILLGAGEVDWVRRMQPRLVAIWGASPDSDKPLSEFVPIENEPSVFAADFDYCFRY